MTVADLEEESEHEHVRLMGIARASHCSSLSCRSDIVGLRVHACSKISFPLLHVTFCPKLNATVATHSAKH